MKIFSDIKNYFQGVYGEMRKVIWPSRREVTNRTLTVIISVLVATLIFGLVDLGLNQLLRLIIERK